MRGSSNFFKILGAVLAERADEVCGKLLALVDVAADLADPSVLLLELGGLRLDIGEIVGVGHGRHVGELPRLGDIGNEERVRLKLDGLRDPGRDESIGAVRQIVDTVGRAGHALHAGKLVDVAAKKALEALGISHISPNSMVYDLSAADQKMVEIAKALSMQPKLLLLDEPSASLTEREITMLFQTIRLLKQEGVAILYISHRLEEIFQIADSVTILRDGQHIISGGIQEFTMDSVILNMVGHSLSEQLEQLQQNRKDFSGGEVTISVEGLSKKGKFQNISFSARKGEIFGISGLVGAGRTELLEAIYGFAPADSGAVKINGNVVQMKNCSAALKRGLALIPEERQRKGLFLQQSVQYNINIAVLKKYKKFLLLQDKQMVQDAVDGVAQLKINTPTIHKLVGELSGGNQQKCIVSRWLYTNPSILLLDEPTHGIDVGTKAEIYRIIRELADKGMTVLFVSSELNELLIMADRIMVMYEGTQRGILNRDEFSQEKVIAMASGIG